VSASSATPLWPRRDSAHLLVSGTAMAGLEQQLFASGLPVEALMEKAALAISRRLLERHRPELERQGALVLVGPGHNGGDGLVVARELHLAGLAVRIWCPFERLKPLTETHLRHALWLGIPRLAEPPDPGEAPIWIDALLGINQSRTAGERLEGLLAERQRRQPNRLVAIDVPTGLCADTGRLTGAVAARAGCTYTVGLLKTGLIQDSALAWVGELERLELGLPAALLQALPHSQPLGLGTADLARAPWPQADRAAGKYERGRLLLVAGSERYRGAAHLALAGARASGCGSVRAALPAALAEQLWQLFPEVVLAGSPGETEGELSPLAQLTRQRLERVDGLLVGPGLGAGRDAAGGPDIWELLQGFPGLLVLDADGLNQLALTQAGRQESGVHRWLQGRGGATWLTPHAAEFQRLFPELAAAPPLEAAAVAAQASGATVLLKGARSVVAAADGRRWQLLDAEPRVARAGLGDVLAGYAAGLGARGLAAHGQVDPGLLALAALAHAEAGRRAAHEGDCSPGAVAQRLNGICRTELALGRE